MRALFTIRDEKNKRLTSRVYQEFVVRCEGQVGGHRHFGDMRKYDVGDQELIAPALLHSPYLLCCHSEAAS